MGSTSAENVTSTDTVLSAGDKWVRESELRPLLTAMLSLREVCREVVRQGRLDARLSASPGQVDIMMPVTDGYEAIRRIRRSPGYADLPIVVLSAKAIPGEREMALTAGANEYLQKPVVDVDRLLKIACDLLAPDATGEEQEAAAGQRGVDGGDDDPPAAPR